MLLSVCEEFGLVTGNCYSEDHRECNSELKAVKRNKYMKIPLSLIIFSQ